MDYRLACTTASSRRSISALSQPINRISPASPLPPWKERARGEWGQKDRPSATIALARSLSQLARPIPALKLIGLLTALGVLASLPANALISPTAPVGATPGSFAVSPTGAATYTIPIVVAPGTNGMQPNLALVYNSQSGNGLLGMGWGLSGLSVIHRCGATIEIDGFKGGVNYNANDRFCMDGERLILVGANEYRTHRESLQRIFFTGASTDPTSFTVRDKDGTTREYGTTADSRIEAQGKTIARLWALSKITDRHGNTLTIAYAEDNPNGDYRPLSINYGANSNTGTGHHSSVTFTYADRSDIVPLYEGGSVIRTIKLLHKITTATGATIVRDYWLTYDVNGVVGRSRLIGAQECGTDGVCLPSSAFTYAPSSIGGWQSDSQFIPPTTLYARGLDSEGTTIIDVDGDGMIDIVRHLWTPQGTYKSAWLHTGSGWMEAPAYTPPHPVYSRGYDNEGTAFVDVNGDGLVDLVRHLWTSAGTYKNVWINTGSGWTVGSVDLAPPTPLWARGYDHEGTQFVDVNGDGLLDLVQHLWTSNGTYKNAWLNTGKGWVNAPEYAPPYPIYSRDIDNEGTAFIDINGDGLLDLVRHLWTEGGTYKNAWLNTGKGWVNAPEYAPPYPLYSRGYDNNGTAFVDANGDGLLDLVQHLWTSNGTYKNAWLNTGKGWVNAAQYAPPYVIYSRATSAPSGTTFKALAWALSQAQAYPSSDNEGTALIDVNGDGLGDLIKHLWVDGVNHTGAWLNKNSFPNVLTAVKTSLGFEAQITYKSLTDRFFYSKDSGTYRATYPYRDLLPVKQVVSQVNTTNGVGGFNTTMYKYGGLKEHVTADTSLGFRWIQVTDPSGLVHVTYHNQNREAGIDGTVAAQETFASGVRIKWVSNNWVNRNPDGICSRRPWPQLDSSTEETRELNNTLVTTVTTTNTYDGCGFPTTVVSSFNDGWRKTVTNTYTHDLTNWRLGMITTAQVTAEAPGQLPQTRTSSFTYNAAGLIASETLEPGNAALSLTTSYAYDTFGNRTSKTVSGPDIVSRTETQTFDPQGRFPIRKTNALGHVTTFEYDPRNGQPTRMTDPNLLVTTWDYDGFGRKGLEVRPDGTRTTITYASTTSGYSIQTRSDGAGDIYKFFDILGREIQANTQGFGGAWIYQSTRYDSLGRVAFKSHPDFNAPSVHGTAFTYDALGRVTAVTEAGNRTTTTSYNGLTTTLTNPLGQVKTTIKNSQGKVIEAIDAAGSTRYQYDPFLNLTQVTDVAGNVTTMTYDLRGRKTAMREPNMGAWTYGYNVLNELTRQTDAKGQTITMTYDALGRLKTRTTPEGPSTWTYDTASKGIGKLASLTGPGGYQESYVYDSLSRVSQVHYTIAGSLYTVTHGYDALGRPDTLTYPSTGYQVKQVYDAFGHLWQVNRRKADGTETLLWQANAADAHARITQETYGNGVFSTRTYHHETGDLQTIQTGTAANPSGLQNLSYTFDALGNLRSRNDAITGLSETFDYDTLNRLTRAANSGASSLVKTYSYDAAGNLTYKSDIGTYTYPTSGPGSVRPHAVSATSGIVNATYTYDANGNLTEGRLSNGKTRTLTWTSFNKPASIAINGVPGTFAYDPNYHRLQKLTPFGATVYVGSLYEKVTSGTLIEHKHYLYGGSSLVAVYTARNNGTEDTKYVHTDHLGSINVITNDNAQVIERLSYDPHGRRRQTNGQDATGPITSSLNRGFTRHEHDEEAGLINMNARLYDPLLGRFISADAVIDGPTSQGLNRYGYALNNPLSLVDPTGHRSLRKALRNIGRAWVKMQVFIKFVAVGFYLGGPQGALAGAKAFLDTNKAYNRGVRGSDLLKIGVGSGLDAYGKLQLLDGAYANSKSAWDFSKYVGKQYVDAKVRGEVAEYAESHGMSLMQLNLRLFGLSGLGNFLTGSRFVEGGFDGGKSGIRGYANRGVFGLPFDVVDTVLAYQGLPTASSVHYLMSDVYKSKSTLVGHSLGALDVANLGGLGLVSRGELYALPFGKVAAANMSVIIGDGDVVNGFGLGLVFNPDARVESVDFIRGHPCANYRGCEAMPNLGYAHSNV